MKRQTYAALWVSPDVHRQIKIASAKKGVPVSKLLGDLFAEKPEERKGGGFRGLF